MNFVEFVRKEDENFFKQLTNDFRHESFEGCDSCEEYLEMYLSKYISNNQGSHSFTLSVMRVHPNNIDGLRVCNLISEFLKGE